MRPPSPERRYFDHNASTPVRPEVRERVLPWLGGLFGNASSVHWAGRQARLAIDDARAEVARALGAAPSELIFTAGGSEADMLALSGVLRASPAAQPRHLVVSAVEHPAVLRTAEALEREGVEVTRVPPNAEGVVSADAVLAAVRPDTRLISLMLANNETGALQPVAEVARRAHERGLLVHTDAVQALGRVPVRVGELGVDLLSLSGHKLGALQGVGALYARRGVALAPLLLGGGQERGRRAGTENVPGIVSLGVAVTLAASELPTMAPRLGVLRDQLEVLLCAALPDARINARGAVRLSNTTSLTVPGVEGEALLLSLDLEGYACSSASACASGTATPSHVLAAMGLSAAEARGTLRLSLGAQTTLADVEGLVEALRRIVARLRSLEGPRAAELAS